jgi:hypothetical protein
MARAGSPMGAATRARISIGSGPSIEYFKRRSDAAPGAPNLFYPKLHKWAIAVYFGVYNFGRHANYASRGRWP